MTAAFGGADPGSDGQVIREYLATVRRRWSIVVAVTVLGVVAALVFALSQQKMYESSAQVLLSQQNLASALAGLQAPPQNAQTANRDVETQAAVARAPAIADAVTAAIGPAAGSRAEFLAHSRVVPQPNANLLNFSVQSPDRELAPRLANTYAEQYRVYKEQLDTAAVQRAREGVAARLATLSRSSALYRELAAQEQTLAQMEALQASNVFVVRPAATARQVQPQVLRAVLLGLSVGLIAGLGLAFLVDALDTRVRDEHEISERLGGVPLLARLEAPPSELRERNELVMLAQPRSVAAEGFRLLATGVEFLRLTHDQTVLMVTSAVEREGKSTTVSNLALALARAGKRVGLIDLDLRRPYVDRFFAGTDLPGRAGVTQVAIGEAALDDALIAVDLGLGDETPTASAGSLSVLPAGVLPPDPGDFVGTPAVAGIIDQLRQRFDVVLVDAPPSLPVSDPLALSSRVDGIIAVVRINVATTKLLDEFRRQLEPMRAAVMGVVVTGTTGHDAYYGGYGYGVAEPAAPKTSELV